MGALSYYLRQARERPLALLLWRLRTAVMRGVRTTLVTAGGKPYAAHFKRNCRLPLGSLFAPATIDAALDTVRQTNPRELTGLVQQADAAARGEFTIYSRRVRTGEAIDWHCDYHSGYSWPIRFHTRYLYADLIDLDRPSDVKVPWELSRLQFLPVLALAYRLTRRDEYHRALTNAIQSWDRSNPAGFGVNWTVGMEVALRAISLILTAEYTHGTVAGGEVATPRLMQLLGEHGRFIYRNLEYSDINGNHYTSCLLGLLYIGLYLPDEGEAPLWRAKALAGLRQEIIAQTYGDGVCHEGSIPYHRLVLEILMHAAVVCRRRNLDLGREYLDRLERMFEFVAGYSKPSGEAPVWGDADDGRVHALGNQAVNDHRYLLTIGAALFERSDLLASAGPLRLDAAVMLEPELLAGLGDLQRRADVTPTPRSTGFPDSGIFVLRRARHYALIDCGDVGYRGRGGHGHNDALSVEIALEGRDVVADTGCASYTRSPVERESVLSARAHNAAIVDGHEPAPISLAEGVRIPHATRCPIEVLGWQPQTGCVTGRHLGYGSAERPTEYRRSLTLEPDSPVVRIEDRIQGPGRRNVEWRFHLAERWTEVTLDSNQASLRTGASEAEVGLRCNHPDARLSLERTPYYPSYDLQRERWCVVVKIESMLPIEARFEISWLPGLQQTPASDPSPGASRNLD